MPIGQRYKAHKNNVIDLFNGYKNKRGDLNDGVDMNFLEKRVDALKNGKFTLAVAGEVKAGKSTFINALLGEELLPSDVLQASSAIVEIFKSESPVLKVKFADDHEETFNDEVKNHLHKICSLNDEYRGIPTTLIDGYIIESGKKPLVIDDKLIENLEEVSGERNLKSKSSTIKKYISKRTTGKIPVQIEFGYPLKWDFDELRIVDTPGVNATGGVQDVTFGFLEKANAILFVRHIKAVETESFKRFLDSTISDRSQETLFLVLSHAGDHSDSEVDRLKNEATRLYNERIPQDRILAVDSLLKIISNSIDSGKTKEQIEESSEKIEEFLPKFEKRAQKSGLKLLDQIEKDSRFGEMLSSIEEFSMKAPSLQLQEILEKIKSGYGEQEKQLSENLKLLETKKRNPQEFEEEIDRISQALSEYRLLTQKTTEDLIQDFSGTNSKWEQGINNIEAKYPKLITNSESIEAVRKNAIDAFDAVDEIINGFQNEITQRLAGTLNKISKTFEEKHRISIPKVDLNSLAEQTKKEAYFTRSTYKDRELDFWDYATLGIARFFRDKAVKTGTEKIFDKDTHIVKYRDACNKDLYAIITDLPKKSDEVREAYLKEFTEKMNSAIKERQDALEQEKDNKRSNDEITKEISALDSKKKELPDEIKKCEELLGEMQW
ncbi:dynamin family protein [Halopseudomonas xiamenensis]|uniref:dynamin family protein n=1 Tax=Halopseudomonas xiamenensis TaxID=157792 RepID=UPI001627F8FE|nr:dynamin family protein [Halopseudomonas xiamenensis]